MDELFTAEQVAHYLGVSRMTVYRWCREERLPCLKAGRSWRVRRSSLEEFLKRNERPLTLTGRLRSFAEVPDNLLVIAQNEELMYRFDAAFFRIGEALGGSLIKYHGESADHPGDPAAALERSGLEVPRLEEEGRLRFIEEPGPPGSREKELGELVARVARETDRSIWVDFDWEERVDLETALEQQRALTKLVQDSRLVIATTVCEEMLDDWPGKLQRRAQVVHSGTVWLSEAGVALSRMAPPVL